MKARKIYLILAVADNGVVGKDGKLPWRLSTDLKHFKSTTNGHCILMGRKTFESFPKPLPGRPHVIITQQKSYSTPYDDCHIVHSLQESIKQADQFDLGDIFIIGGASIAKEALEAGLIDMAWITRVKGSVEGDTIVDVSTLNTWKELKCTQYSKDKKNEYEFDIVLLKKTQNNV